jgi:hypothetical protein
MKISIGLTALVIVTISPAIQAQMPDDNVSSDSSYNTAMGTSALFSNDISSNQSPGGFNLAVGYQALYSNSTGSSNVATGYRTLYENTSGNYNVAVGSNALSLNVVGGYNTATGTGALLSSNGSNNTAVGAESLGGNAEGDVSTGSNNTAVGFMAMNHFTFGSNNTASGFESLLFDTTGNYNTASGYEALHNATTGDANVAVGSQALYSNTIASFNTALGQLSLYAVTTGGGNTALGHKAGYNIATGNNNIDIANPGVASDTEVTRIGTQGTQKSAYIAGISGVPVTGTGIAVVVNSSGQLGIAGSSDRFKTAITPMGQATGKLEELKPVTFRYKSDAHGVRQYGLIAEEVAKVYPELVVHDPTGQIIGVRYDELAPMLLNEVQKERVTISAQNQKIATLELQVAELNDLKQELHAALIRLQARDELVAAR